MSSTEAVQPRIGSTDNYDRLVTLIYAGVCDDAAFLQALELVAAQHECASAVFVYADRMLPNTDIVVSYGPFSRPEVQARYQAEFAIHDPAPGAMARLPVGEAAATNRLFPPEFLATSRFLNEFYRPLGLEEALGGPVINGDGRIGLVAIHRGRDRPPFSDDEITKFRRLLSHFGQALTLRRRFYAALDDRHATVAALESASQSVLILDKQATVLHANLRARQLLAKDDGLTLSRTGRLLVGDAEAANRLVLALASPSGRAIVRVRRQNDRRPYVIRLAPAADVIEAPGHPSRLLYVFDPDHSPAKTTATLMAALGLSSQAAALVAALLSGADLAAYAASAGISRNTAKFHLQAAFAATGTARQSDLLRFTASLLRDLGEPPSMPFDSDARPSVEA